MVRFYNNDELGIEGLTGKAVNTVKSGVKKAVGQADKTAQDIVNHLYGIDDAQNDQDGDGDKGIEGAGGQAQKKAKAQTNVRNPAQQQAAARRIQMQKRGKGPEEVEKLEKLRRQLHDEYFKELTQPKKRQQEEEERPAEKIEKEQEEKKRKEQQKKMEEQKKKEDLSVVQKRTATERRPGAG